MLIPYNLIGISVCEAAGGDQRQLADPTARKASRKKPPKYPCMTADVMSL